MSPQTMIKVRPMTLHSQHNWAYSGAGATHYLIVCVIQHRFMTVFKETTQKGIICKLLNILNAVEKLHYSALYKFTTDSDNDCR